MARIGINPARGKVTTATPQAITVAMITYLPEQSGYFTHRLDVLRLALAGLGAHTTLPHDVIVFDNGSCPEALAVLQQAQQDGIINFLLLSDRNIGKVDALKVLCQAAPGDVIAYMDDDILVYPGWLEISMDVLERFPKAGMVSATPVRDSAGHARASLDAFTAGPPRGITVLHERRIRDEWEADWAVSTGRDPQAHRSETVDKLDLVFHYQTADGPVIEAIAGANHFQFITYKGTLLQALPAQWTGKLMGSMLELDEAVDRQGLLRLSTVQRYARHLGNALSPEASAEARAFGLAVGEIPAVWTAGKRRRHPVLRLPGARRILMGMYNWLFKILFQSQ